MGDIFDTGNIEEELDFCEDDSVEQESKSPRSPTPGESFPLQQNPTSCINNEESSGVQEIPQLPGMTESTLEQSPISPVSSKGSSRRGRKRRNDHPELMNGYSSSECASVVSVDASFSREGSSYSASAKRGKKQRYKANIKTLLPVGTDSWTIGKIQEGEYIVEKIVGKKFIDTEDGELLHYHIKWKGWGPAHNTWEPLDNLQGCQEMVERYESSRLNKRDNDVDSDDSDGGRIIDHEKKDHFRNELVGCLVDSKWPTHLIPLEVYGVIEVDRHMCYVVRHKAPKYTEKLTPENCIVVRASGFRTLFPHIIISFYESSILWVQRNEAKEKLAKKARKALETSERQIRKKAKRKRKKKKIPNIVKIEPMDEPQAMEVDYESMDNMNYGIKQEIDEDRTLDEDGLPLPIMPIKRDVHGLANGVSDSSESEEDLEEIDDLFVLKTKSKSFF
ncbi:uncharacterized protein LOC110847934 isoform X2 [Folsomia candida]|uniref:Heterochromatin protein 1 n=1 Tax=Folsomia candida TaxID=158441 RepID=A0A226EHE0_FOLCA|nr:uncharacterized protein LOC110847934 isoform X2 [Folsomia candida]OXA57083.1 Heterochromatin protein 1 [Folsomia candida]